MEPEEVLQDQYDECVEANISAGDFEGELVDKFEIITTRTKPRLGFFESREYFDKLFPSFKIQKPGQDLYLKTTLFLALIAYYVFAYYGQMGVDEANYLKNSNNNIFKGDMVIVLLIVILIIVMERYVNRSDTKAVV